MRVGATIELSVDINQDHCTESSCS